MVPVLAFYLLEFYEHNPFTEVRTEAQWFNILLLELLAWGLFFLTKKAVYALRVELIFTLIFGLVNHYVAEFRSTPFVPWDILSAKTAASVAGNYDYTPPLRVIVVTVLFLVLCFTVRYLEFSCALRLPFRLIPAALFGMALCLLVSALQNESFQTRHYLYPFLFTPSYMTKVNGMLVTFSMNLEYIAVEKPQGYDAGEAQKTLASYAKAKDTEDSGNDTETDNGAGDAEETGLPNIIVIMDEAFSDLSVLGNFMASEDPMPFVHSLQNGADNTITGYLNVSVCGGNTANTEFEFLTGNTMAFLPNGSIPYQQYIKKETPSLAQYLSGLGYETCGMHPYNASGWDRERVYPLLGFSDMLFFDDFINKTFVRKYVSDESDFSNIIAQYEKKQENKPLFLFNVTMQNHGSYVDAYDNFTPDVTVQGTNSFVLSQYLSLVKKTDTALEELIRYFQSQKEKTVIVFFGDHQPADSVVSPVLALNGKDTSDPDDETGRLRYQVPYVIWANFGIDAGSGVDTSANYLAAHVLSAAGVPLSDYQNYLLELEKTYPVVSASRVVKENAQGKWEETDRTSEKKGLLEYQRLQYYRLFDWKNETKQETK